MIERIGLNPELAGRKSTSEIVAKMRDRIRFSRIVADAAVPRAGQPASAAVSFDVGFEGGRPDTALRVVQEIASLYMEEDVRARERRWAGSQAGLESELRSIKEGLDEFDARIADYKDRHAESLPDRAAESRREMQRMDRDIERLRSA